MMFSLGCPYKCTFCITDKEVRYRPIDTVIQEIKYLLKQGAGYIQFQDDSFTIRKDLVKELCRKIVSEKLDFVWDCTTRADLVDIDTFKSIKKAGCKLVKIGIETADESLRNSVLKKHLANQSIVKAFQILRGLGFDTAAFLLSGFPGERLEDAKNTYNFVKALNADFIDFYIAVAIPGSELFEKGLTDGIFEPDIWENVIKNNIQMPVYVSEALPLKRLRQIQKKAILKHYFTPKQVINRVLKNKDAGLWRHYLKVAVKLLKNVF